MSLKPRNLTKIEKGGLRKDLHKSYTSVCTRSYIIIYTYFEVLRLKIMSEGTLVQMGVTKPSVTSTHDKYLYSSDIFLLLDDIPLH